MLPAAAGWALRALKLSAKNRHSAPHNTASSRTPAGSGPPRRQGSGWPDKGARRSHPASASAAAGGRSRYSQGCPSRTPAQKQAASSALPYTAVKSGARPGAWGPNRRASSQPGSTRYPAAAAKKRSAAARSAPQRTITAR